MDGRQSGCYAPDPGLPRLLSVSGKTGLAFPDGGVTLQYPRRERSRRPGPTAGQAQGRDGPLDPKEHPSIGDGDRGATGRRASPVVALAAALAPAVLAVWWHPGFVTQDGPAHHYNAHILTRSFDDSSPYSPYFRVQWEPLPNWAGHLALMALDATLPPRTADRAMSTLTLVGFAAAVYRLRLRVAGRRGASAAAVFSALLGLNVAWLLGFSGFLLGACLFPLTLGYWWAGREGGWSARRALGLAGLVTVGYFSHLVSLGLTAAGLAVLEALTPGRRRAGRASATAAGLVPLLPLGLLYLRLMRRGGGSPRSGST